MTVQLLPDPCAWCSARAFGLPCPIHGAGYQQESTDTTHACVDGKVVDDATVPTETNEHGDRWCSRCGERILVDPQDTFDDGMYPEVH